MENLYVCFFGDGRLWDNVSLVAAYPSGFSYFRAFRYRDERIQGAVLDEMGSRGKLERLVGAEAILAMRFVSEKHKSLLLPVRRIEISHIDYMRDNHSIYFTMGPLVDFGQFRDLQSACVEVPPKEGERPGEPALFFRASIDVPDDYFATKHKEPGAWTAYSDLVAGSEALPIREEARQSVFLRIWEPSDGQATPVECLHESRRMGKVCGASLTEGKDYELVIAHRVPGLIGRHTTMGRLSVNYEAPSGNIALSVTEEEYTGNYETHVLLLTAERPSGTYEQLIVKPEASEFAADDGSRVRAVSLPIRLGVQRSVRYRIRRFWGPLLLLFLLLTASSLLGTVRGEETNVTVIAAKVAVNLCATLLIGVLRERI